MLANGHTYRNRKETIITRLTCPFDSIFHLVLVLFSDYQAVRDQINAIKSNSFSDMIKLSSNLKKKEITGVYKRRTLLLAYIFRNRMTVQADNVKTFKCNSTLNFVIEKVLPFELYSVKYVKRCLKCKDIVHDGKLYAPLNLDDYDENGVSDLEANIVQSVEASPNFWYEACACSSSLVSDGMNFNNLVFVDIQTPDEKYITINQIPAKLNINKVQMKLVGVVEFIPPPDIEDEEFIPPDIEGEGNTGHFLCHVQRHTNVWQTFNNGQKKSIATNIHQLMDIHLLVYLKD